MKRIRIDRAKLLSRLEAVQPGLSNREQTEQSSCFGFQKGKVMTFNDEVTCTAKSLMPKEFYGAVKAEPLLKLLRKLKEETIEVAEEGGEFTIYGDRKKSGILMEAKVNLPMDAVQIPEEWFPLPEDFTEAVQIVQECAGTDANKFDLTCVRLTPKWLEAFDNIRASRYKIVTGIKDTALIRRDSIKHILQLDMTEIAETSEWIHFRNPAGLMLSCRRYLEEKFPNLTPMFKMDNGEPAIIPKELGPAAESAEIFSGTEKDANLILVELIKNKVRIKGEGATGYYSEWTDISYKGREIKFLIPPHLLVSITKNHTKCKINEDMIRVNGGNFVFFTVLKTPEGD